MSSTRRRGAGALLPALAGLVLFAGCGPVEVDVPALSKDDRAACEAFADALPQTLAEKKRVEIEPADAPAAAYGDPAIVVRCGVGKPKGFDLTASCESANGVGFYIPDEQYDDQGLDVTLTTPGYRPRIEAVIPADYRPNAVAAVMAELSPLVEEHLTLVDDCDDGDS